MIKVKHSRNNLQQLNDKCKSDKMNTYVNNKNNYKMSNYVNNRKSNYKNCNKELNKQFQTSKVNYKIYVTQLKVHIQIYQFHIKKMNRKLNRVFKLKTE